MKKTLLTNYYPPREAIAPYLEQMDFIMPSADQVEFSRSQVLELLPQADALWRVGLTLPVDREMIQAGPRLQAIGTLSVGYNDIDWRYAAAQNIPVINTPHTVTEATAELAVALMLAAMRSLPRQDSQLRRSGRLSFSYFDSFSTRAYGKTLGLVGFGRIGRAVARKARGLGMKVVYFDPLRADAALEQEAAATYLPFEQLLRQADVVSLHLPQTPETVGLFGAEQFALMKPTAYFINAARGGLVQEAELARALAEGRLRGAGLDVYQEEPLIHPALLSLDNVVLAPHVGTWTADTRIEMAHEVLDGIAEVFRGRLPDNLVNRELLPR